MSELFIVGGQMRHDGARMKEWRFYQKAVVSKVCLETFQAELVHEYVSPLDVCPEQPSVVFKAGALEGNHLFVCTQTEVLVFRLPDFRIVHYVSLPCFNDLHHVVPTSEGTLLIAVTGLDMVVEVDMQGGLVNDWDVMGGNTWLRFSKNVDYRKVPTTQPHMAHPNYVFMLGDEVWVTRCDLKDAICLANPEKRIDLSGVGFHPVEIVHDGVLYNGALYFTAVDGNVLIVDPATYQVTQVIDLKKIVQSDYPLGWCRGIKILDEERVIVAFSRLRRTKLHDKVRWAKAQVKRISGMEDYKRSLPSLPTRICCFNLRRREQEWELPLAGVDIDAVFSIL